MCSATSRSAGSTYSCHIPGGSKRWVSESMSSFIAPPVRTFPTNRSALRNPTAGLPTEPGEVQHNAASPHPPLAVGSQRESTLRERPISFRPEQVHLEADVVRGEGVTVARGVSAAEAFDFVLDPAQ